MFHFEAIFGITNFRAKNFKVVNGECLPAGKAGSIVNITSYIIHRTSYIVSFWVSFGFIVFYFDYKIRLRTSPCQYPKPVNCISKRILDTMFMVLITA